MHFRFRLLFGVAALCNGPPLMLAEGAPALRSAASFAVLGTSVTNNGSTIVTGDLAAAKLDGFPPGSIRLGRRMSESAAMHDAEASWNDLARRVCNRQAETFEGTLAPGVTCFASSARLSGTLTLDAGNETEAFWIIRVPMTLTVDADAIVRMTGGGRFGNVYWQVDSATLGVNATLLGNVLAHRSITLGHAVTVSGRLFAQQSVSLETNLVTLCCEPLTLTSAVAPAVAGHKYETTLAPQDATFTIVSGAPPPGLTLSSAGVLSGTPTAEGTSTFTVMATDPHDCAGLRQYTLTVRASAPDVPVLSPWMLFLLSVACVIVGSFHVRNA